ncbi:TetR/AcrR family transcriptional regulator [Saccharomonospora saliphila]|uniref:TetR/AcrR family transcriptional regulator n=1 Tax=Saccharomonospora saliphila TaxID=369829 RepID=UPI000377BAB7|nr:TetR/AcrR family transcriptional regulator [Saccharomonospora saliphila]
MNTDTGPGRPLTPGAQRILDVASELFYRHGIHAVGVDTIAAESGVTKRTLYDRFASKDNLVAAYLDARDRRWRDMVTTRLHDAPPDPVTRVLVPFDELADSLKPSTRGCAFINAFAELPNPDHPGHRIVVAAKAWLRALFRDLLIEAATVGENDAETLAIQLLSLHEGAIVSYAINNDTPAVTATRAAAKTLVTGALPGPHPAPANQSHRTQHPDHATGP